MFKITNLSANALILSDGRPLAPHDSRDLETVTDRDRGFEKRGWLQIHDETVAAAAASGSSKTPATPATPVVPPKQEGS